MKTYTLGIDIGSISLKAAVLGPDLEPVFSSYRYTEAKPALKLAETLQETKAALGDPLFRGIVFTGSGKKRFTRSLSLPGLNEIIAHARGCWENYPDVKSILEIGGQDSKFIRVDRRRDGTPFVENFQFNGLCSAGTGAFLDQQSERLDLSIEEFSRAAYGAETVPSIAGRCSVFAKSDMIHLQQKGTGTAAISAGLCFALARNYLATLCKGRIPPPPVVFQGGVASNRGMLRAFSQILKIPENEIIIPEYHKWAGAYGAALHAGENPLLREMSLGELLRLIENTSRADSEEASANRGGLRRLARGSAGRRPIPGFEENAGGPFARAERGGPLYIGLDIGSVGTKGVLLDGEKRITASASEPTRSEPIRAAADVLRRLGAEAEKAEARIAGFYTTGSGRYLIGEIFGADEAVDEITCHSRSAVHWYPETDTIFEIGGQDSKLIRLEGGTVKNFVMNRLCAAGTGSFLEEQAGRLSIDIQKDFSEYAFRSLSPAQLGTRCTVFMDSDLVHHIQRGESAEDLCAGLSFSIVENYLENVTASADLGENIIFQGGVANNEAVHAAFESRLGRGIALHPAPSFAGAAGAAILASEERDGKPTRFPGFTATATDFTVTYERCEDCANRCDIMAVSPGGAKKLRFGSACGKHDTARPVSGKKKNKSEIREESPLDIYRRLALSGEYGTSSLAGRGRITIPLGLTAYEDYPFWSAFFTALGYEVNHTGESTPEIARRGKEQLPVETCMPVRLLYGHALAAADTGEGPIFVPHTPSVIPRGGGKPRYLCPYTQTSGYIIRKKINAPVLILGKPEEGKRREWIHRTSRALEIGKKEIASALERARGREEEFRARCVEEGRRILAELKSRGKKGLVLIGRPYVAYDGYLNIDLAEKIERFGMVPLPADFLDLEREKIGPFWEEVHWQMGRKLLQAASVTRRHPLLHPVILTSFGCGPDGFIVPFIEEILGDTPRLVLEFDENRIDTGLVTRVEAFTRSLRNGASPGKKRPASSRRGKGEHTLWRPEKPLEKYRLFIPYFSDHAYAYAGALGASGCTAEVLPPTDERSLSLARQYSSGNECHPFLTILGDLLRLAKDVRSGGGGKEAVYYSPKYIGSCLINAYETSMQIALDKMGAQRVHLLDFGNMELMKDRGLIYPYYLAMSSYTIDRLTKWAHEITPYEKRSGSVMKVHRENMELLLRRMEEKKLMKGIREAVLRMEEVPLLDIPRRPAVGIAGDVFTRINPAANFGLFAKLRENGFDTMASALIMDVVLYRYEQLYKELGDDGKAILSLGARTVLPAVTLLKSRVDRLFPPGLRTPQESQFPLVHERTKDFIDYRVDNLISLNLNRIYELHSAGAKGVLNVMCPNCMVGTMSEAFFPEIKEERPELPLTSLSFGDQQETHVDNRLEAFMHLVRESEKKGKSS